VRDEDIIAAAFHPPPQRLPPWSVRQGLAVALPLTGAKRLSVPPSHGLPGLGRSGAAQEGRGEEEAEGGHGRGYCFFT